MKKLSLVVLFIFVGCSTPKPKKVEQPVPETVESPAEVSFMGGEEKTSVLMLDHKYFQVAYDQKTRLARYVYYSLSADKLKNKNATRKNKFKADPILVKQEIPFVKPLEYLKTGYDQGHLAPSADFAWDQTANDTTFYMSNMAPQTRNLNRDAWKRLEEKVRKWACGEGMVTVLTGPILSPTDSKLKSGLQIPSEFFKIIIDETSPRKWVAFIYKQSDKGDLLNKRLATIDTIEKATKESFKSFLSHFKAAEKKTSVDLKSWKEADCDTKKVTKK